MSGADPDTAAPRTGIRAWVKRRLTGRPDSEHEMAFNRFVFAGVIAAYVFAVQGHDSAALAITGVYGLIGAVLMGLILWDPRRNDIRRAAALVCDLGILTLVMHVGEEATSLLYPIYLWITLGNGFRFGMPWLYGAMGVSLAGFGLLIVTTPFWSAQEHLSIGLLIGLLIVPGYAGTLIKKLSLATKRAEDASQAKSMFLASVSHELRTPLNAIIGLGALLHDTKLDEEQRDMAGTMNGAARQLLALIDDILDFSRIEAGQMPVHVTEFDLVQLMAELRAMFASQARAKGIRLSMHLTLRTPQHLRADPMHIREVLQNLVGNAVKFTESGSVVIAADAVEREDGRIRLRFEVTDTGIGIAPEAAGRIFESFTQADPTIVNRFGGTGLGLTISQRLAKLLGGEIGVTSTPGAGSTFWFTLPVERGETVPKMNFAGTRMVLLSAARPQSGLLVARLTRLGATVRTVPTLAQAATVLAERREGERAALMVWPDHMGVGFADIVSALRALDPLAETPTLLLTDEEPPAGLPEPELQRSFQAILPGGAQLDTLAAALVLAREGRPVPVADAAGVPEATRPRRSLRILVADDNRTNQKVVAKILERGGHRVHAVNNGEEALDALETSRFDLVLMDLNMPVMDGIEATKMFRFASLGRPRTPVLALTADASPEAARRAAEADMDGCLLKPVQPAHLLEVIDQHVPEGAEVAPVPADPARAPPPVADIATHPRFRPAGASPFDEVKLQELRDLGGEDFVRDLVTEFVDDATEIIASLGEVLAVGDMAEFRNMSHALRSSAANVGAKAIYELCRFADGAKPGEVLAQGPAHVERLQEELDRIRAALAARRNEGGQARH